MFPSRMKLTFLIGKVLHTLIGKVLHTLHMEK